MATLLNFPMVSQLSQITSDGRPSENAAFDCVAASIGAAILYFQGKTQWDEEVNPDKMKDLAYGEAYRNMGTAARDYVDFCTSLGVHLYAVQGNPGQLVQMIHAYLADGKPVIFTEPDPYVSSALGWTHVCVFYQDGPGFLTAMDPYIARPVHRTDQEWIQLLQNNEIWIAERMMEDTMRIDIHSPNVANYFTETSPGWWTCKQTGKVVHGEVLTFYCAIGGLLDLGLPVSNEIPLDANGNTKQYYERGVLFFDPKHVYDNPPGAGRVYKAHLYSGAGQDPKLAELVAQVKTSGVDPKKVANRLQALELLAKQIEQTAIAPL